MLPRNQLQGPFLLVAVTVIGFLTPTYAQCNCDNFVDAGTISSGSLQVLFEVKDSSSNCTEDIVCFQVPISANDRYVAIGLSNSGNTMPKFEPIVVGRTDAVGTVLHSGSGNDYLEPFLQTDTCIANIAVTNNNVVFSRTVNGSLCQRQPSVDITSSGLSVALPQGTWNGGSTASGRITEHSNPVAIAQSVNLLASTTTQATASGAERSEQRTHGIIMVVAWLSIGTNGIFVARYTKDVFGDGGTWLIAHIVLQVTTAAMTLAGVVYIFHVNDNDSWSTDRWSDDTDGGKHQIFGMVTLALVLLQVVLGASRNVISGAPEDPSDPKDHGPRRFLFNFSHIPLGYTSLVMAAVAIWYGLEKYGQVEDAQYTLYGWGGALVLFALVLETHVLPVTIAQGLLVLVTVAVVVVISQILSAND